MLHGGGEASLKSNGTALKAAFQAQCPDLFGQAGLKSGQSAAHNVPTGSDPGSLRGHGLGCIACMPGQSSPEQEVF